jgi:hypothetical protein
MPELLQLNVLKVYVEAPQAIRWARFQREYRLRGWTESAIEDVFQAREREEIPISSARRPQWILCVNSWRIKIGGKGHCVIISRTPLRMSFVGGGR